MAGFDWPESGERVSGTYLGRDFAGVVLNVGFEQASLGRRYTIKFDQPVEVSRSALMSIPRQRVTALVNATGVSIDAKGRADGIMVLSRA